MTRSRSNHDIYGVFSRQESHIEEDFVQNHASVFSNGAAMFTQILKKNFSPKSQQKKGYDTTTGLVGSVIRYSLEPGTFVVGYFPLTPFVQDFVLIAELLVRQSNNIRHTRADSSSSSPWFMGAPTQTAIDDDIASEPPITSNHAASTSIVTSTTSSLMAHSLASNAEQQNTVVLRAYHIEHKGDCDVVLTATSTKPLYFFSHDYKNFCIEPVTYRFFPDYHPCEKGPLIDLTKNVFGGVQLVSDKRIKATAKKKILGPAGATANPLLLLTPEPLTVNTKDTNSAGRSDASQGLYEYCAVERLQESSLFLLSIIKGLNDKATIMVIVDGEQSEQTNQLHDLIKRYIGSCMAGETDSDVSVHSAAQVAFAQAVALLHPSLISGEAIDSLEFKLHEKRQRCLRVAPMGEANDKPSSEEDSTADSASSAPVPIEQKLEDFNIDGIIVIAPVRTEISPSLVAKLKKLEGFPTLFIFSGLNKCNDIFEAIKQKEQAEDNIMSMYSRHFKPHIVHYQDSTNTFSKENQPSFCKYFREVLDVAAERIILEKPLSDISSVTQRVLHKYYRYEKVVKKQQEELRKTTRRIWFFGLDNEKESAMAAFHSLKSQAGAEKHLIIRSREQFAHPKEILKNLSQKQQDDEARINRMKIIMNTFVDVINNDNSAEEDTATTAVPAETTTLTTSKKEEQIIKEEVAAISKQDIVVLCVELSGRVLITGKNGIFTAFATEILKLTPNLVLFVDRLDRSDNSARYEDIKVKVIHHERLRVLHGDDLDFALDEDLRIAQQMHTYFTHRCFYLSSRDVAVHEKMQEFWQQVHELAD